MRIIYSLIITLFISGYALAAPVSGQNLFEQAKAYHDGQGVPQDYARAQHIYRQAAQMGYSDAMLNLGYMYFVGQGVPQNYDQARSWYEQAARLGNRSAMANLNMMNQRGLGISARAVPTGRPDEIRIPQSEPPRQSAQVPPVSHPAATQKTVKAAAITAPKPSAPRPSAPKTATAPAATPAMTPAITKDKVAKPQARPAQTVTAKIAEPVPAIITPAAKPKIALGAAAQGRVATNTDAAAIKSAHTQTGKFIPNIAAPDTDIGRQSADALVPNLRHNPQDNPQDNPQGTAVEGSQDIFPEATEFAGMVVENVRARLSPKQSQLVVTGEIRNLTQRKKNAPTLILSVKDAQGTTLQSWPVLPHIGRIAPFNSISFQKTINDLPKGAKVLKYEFERPAIIWRFLAMFVIIGIVLCLIMLLWSRRKDAHFPEMYAPTASPLAAE